MKVLLFLLFMSAAAFAGPKSAIITQNSNITVPAGKTLTILEFWQSSGMALTSITIGVETVSGPTISTQYYGHSGFGPVERIRPFKLSGPAVFSIYNNPSVSDPLKAFITYEIGVK